MRERRRLAKAVWQAETKKAPPIVWKTVDSIVLVRDSTFFWGGWGAEESDDVQRVIAVTDEISAMLTKAWFAMIGTWMERPMPMPARAW